MKELTDPDMTRMSDDTHLAVKRVSYAVQPFKQNKDQSS